MTSIRLKRFVPMMVLAGIVLVWLCIVVSQNRLTALRSVNVVEQSMAYVPQSDKVKSYMLGFQSVYADYLWIKTTLYFGSHYMTDGQYPWLIHMVDFVTRLNPNFYPAYEFAGLMIPEVCKNPTAARIILERGLSSHVSHKWKLFYYLGMLCYTYTGDKAMAASYFSRGVMQPGAPGYRMAGLAATMFAKAGQKDKGRAFLEFAYMSSENPEVKRYLLAKLRSYEKKNIH